MTTEAQEALDGIQAGMVLGTDEDIVRDAHRLKSMRELIGPSDALAGASVQSEEW